MIGLHKFNVLSLNGIGPSFSNSQVHKILFKVQPIIAHPTLIYFSNARVGYTVSRPSSHSLKLCLLNGL